MCLPDKYAVIGFPIHHSKSPRIHTLFAQQTGQNIIYDRVEVKPENFASFVEFFFKEGGKGLNCTVPHKEAAYHFATVLTDRAHFAKAVNTLIVKDGEIMGDNTDGMGLIYDLTINHRLSLANKRLLILGAGGATRGIMAPLIAENPSEIIIANRTLDKATLLVKDFSSHTFDVSIEGCGFADLNNHQFDIILNATSASLSGDVPPLPDAILAPDGICYDLAYSNEPTAFVRWGLENNALKSIDGLGMLVEQAAEAFYVWRGVRPDTLPVIKLLNAERIQE
jgi:shikimate dehydrogenase